MCKSIINLLKTFRRDFCQKSNLIGINIRKPTQEGYDKSQFLDTKILKLKGGKGGDGIISLLRLFCNPFGGPDGGDGGNGGHIIIKCCSQTVDLRCVPSIFVGNNGHNGMSKGMDGSNGEHIYIRVPVGTLIKCFETGNTLADMTSDEEEYVAARGGEGGKGNKFFLTEEHRAPTIAERGGEGEDKKLILEVKLLADIGLIGIPNSGKSTLLRALTRAKPKVASYAFTTLRPHIGKIEFTNVEFDPITICDIPGIIKDAHKNRGLGLTFLRHIERCHILAFIIDLSNNPIDQFWTLANELNEYRPLLLQIPRLIICNKMDIPGTRKSFEEFKSHMKEMDNSSSILAISALNSVNLNAVISEMRTLRDKNVSDISCL